MHHKRLLFSLTSSGLLMLVFGLLLVVQPVDAQCGSQASSCKNCHEVQAVDPVNNDGTGWHQSHAFGDFCTMCHAGNPQATDEDGAHTGMVPPLEDIAASCEGCHPDDLVDRAQVYALALNIELNPDGGSSGGDAAVGGGGDTAVSSTPVPVQQVVIGVPASNELAVDDPNLVDYVQRYNEIVLGEREVNYGNVALIVLIAVVVLAGGGFVLVNEIRRAAAGHFVKAVDGQYPADVVDMLPAISGLKAETRKSLNQIVADPKKADAVVGLIKSLTPNDKPEDSVS